MKRTSGGVLLIDSDVLLYQACSIAVEEVEWEMGRLTLELDQEMAKQYIKNKLSYLLEFLDVPGVEPVFCFGDESREYFRKELDPDYKKSRSHRPPLGFAYLRAWIRKKYFSYALDKVETDDAVRIFSSVHDMPVYVWSIDKDFFQIPGTFLHEKSNGEIKVHEVTPESADMFHRQQTLIGDPSDGYPGCPGIGPKTCHKHTDSWESVRKVFPSEEDFLLQARLAFILDAEHYNEGDIKLWTPPS